jgi:hypothetical protein
MTFTGGILTWVCGVGIEMIAGEIATTPQFRMFGGVALGFAVGGGAFLKTDTSYWGHRGYERWFAVFAIPGMIWASPVFLFSPESTSLPVLAVIWGAFGGGVAYFIGTCLNVAKR